MKIVADNKIPYLKGILEQYAEVVYLPGKAIKKQDVLNADALLIRTRTICDENLLSGTNVRFIGTATIGYDHIDTDYCDKNNIRWVNAPGCNAASVMQYVICSLLTLSLEENMDISEKTIGIIGVGNVGKKVATICRQFGMNVLLNDPPRAQHEAGFVDLKTIATESDIITFHTPLTIHGEFATFHLADDDFFNSLKKRPVIINTARGEVVDTESLLRAMQAGRISETIIDCWENEPEINRLLLQHSFLSTPHIAGYSADGKANASRMVLTDLSDYFRLNMDLTGIVPPDIENNEIDLNAFPNHRTENALLKTYNPKIDSDLLRKNPEDFESFRENYPLRREFNAYTVQNANAEEAAFFNVLMNQCANESMC